MTALLRFVWLMLAEESTLSSERLYLATDLDRYRHHSQIVDGSWASYGRIGGRIVGPDRDRNSIGRPAESTNLDLWGSPSLIHQPKNIHSLDLGLPTHV